MFKQVRRSVTVIPRSDAESRKHQECQIILIVNNGFRVGARNDGYRVPHLRLILYDYNNHTLRNPACGQSLTEGLL